MYEWVDYSFFFSFLVTDLPQRYPFCYLDFFRNFETSFLCFIFLVVYVYLFIIVSLAFQKKNTFCLLYFSRWTRIWLLESTIPICYMNSCMLHAINAKCCKLWTFDVFQLLKIEMKPKIAYQSKYVQHLSFRVLKLQCTRNHFGFYFFWKGFLFWITHPTN